MQEHRSKRQKAKYIMQDFKTWNMLMRCWAVTNKSANSDYELANGEGGSCTEIRLGAFDFSTITDKQTYRFDHIKQLPVTNSGRKCKRWDALTERRSVGRHPQSQQSLDKGHSLCKCKEKAEVRTSSLNEGTIADNPQGQSRGHCKRRGMQELTVGRPAGAYMEQLFKAITMVSPL